MVVLAEHIGDELSIFQGNSPLDVRRVERLEAVCEWLEVFAI